MRRLRLRQLLRRSHPAFAFRRPHSSAPFLRRSRGPHASPFSPHPSSLFKPLYGCKTHEHADVIVTVNGEIYNYEETKKTMGEHHVWNTASDCEVIAHLYEDHGEDCVSKASPLTVWPHARARVWWELRLLGSCAWRNSPPPDRGLAGSS